MGILGSIGKFLLGDPTDDIRRGTEQAVAGQQQALDYTIDANAPLLGARDAALPLLTGFFTGDPAAQESLVSNAMASPFYRSLVEAGEEGVLRNRAMTGGFRSGSAQTGLADVNQNVLRDLVNQQLSGLSGLASLNPDTASVANLMAGIGQTQSQGTIAEANANQAIGGSLLSGITGGLGLAGNLGWKPFV
jgi:hypothetical protein